LARELRTTRVFDRSFQRLLSVIQEQALAKLDLFQSDAAHPSLRVKRVKGTDRVWEMTVTMNYRITFEVVGDVVLLRRIGTHDIVRNP